MSRDTKAFQSRTVLRPGGRQLGRRGCTALGAAALASVVSAPARPVVPPIVLPAYLVERVNAARVAPPANRTSAPDAPVPVPPPAPDSPAAAAPAAAAARITLLRACAPAVDPATLLAVIDVESGGDPLAVNINRGRRVRPQSADEAVAIAEAAIAAGHSVDLGLMQVNSRNLGLLGTTVARMFDPCANVRAGAALLADAYAAAARAYGEGQPALRAALSAYNTGDFARGFANGYVARYYRDGAGAASSAPAPVTDARSAADGGPLGDPPAAGNPYNASPTVYTRARWNATPAWANQTPAPNLAFTTR